MIETGVDWSGDPGRPRDHPNDSKWLVVAACHLDVLDSPAVEAALGRLRLQLKLPDQHVFKHLKSVQSTRNQFLEMLRTTPVRVTAICVDKHIWTEVHLRHSTGPQRIVYVLTELAREMDEADVGGQRLLVDARRSDKGFITELRRSLRDGLRREGRDSFRKVAPRPDDRSDAFLIQAADMIAGDLRRRVARGELDAVCGSKRWKVAVRA